MLIRASVYMQKKNIQKSLVNGYKHSLVGNVDLLQLGLSLDRLDALLLHVPVRRLPHVVILH